MAPNDVDVPRAVSLDYFNEVCPREECYIINDNDLKKDLPWDPPAKVIDNALLKRVYVVDVWCIDNVRFLIPFQPVLLSSWIPQKGFEGNRGLD